MIDARADDKSAFPSRCPECDASWTSMGSASRTLVGYRSPPGHEHNNNCLSRSIWCANGHRNQAWLGVRMREAFDGMTGRIG